MGLSPVKRHESSLLPDDAEKLLGLLDKLSKCPVASTLRVPIKSILQPGVERKGFDVDDSLMILVHSKQA